MNVEIMKYVLYILRRFWVVILFAALLGGASYWYFNSQDPVYRAETQVFVGGSSLLADPSVNAINEGLRLAPTYAEFVELEPTLNAVIDELDLTVSTRRLAGMISTRVIIDTSILVIRVNGSDPDLIAAIANEVARQLVLNSPSNLSEDELQQMEILREQINQLRANIDVVNEQAIELLAELNRASEEGNTRRVDALTEQYNQATDRLTTARSALTQASETYSSFSNRLNRLQIIEEASVPTDSSNRNPMVVAVIAAMAGAGAGIGGLLLLFEYIDHKLRTEREINTALELPVLGIIKRSFRVGLRFGRGQRSPSLLHMPIAEGYRTIQTNLLFSPLGTNNGKLYLIASPKSKEGRTFTATNLAMTIADSGLKVLLIDADMRKSKLHEVFNLSNDKGVLSLSKEKMPDEAAFEALLESHVQHTDIPTLDIITSGITGDSQVFPAQIFGSDSLKKFIRFVRDDERYDVIFMDTSGALEVADSFMLAAATKANIVLLVRAAYTSIDQALKTRDQYEHIGGNIRGVILNRA